MNSLKSNVAVSETIAIVLLVMLTVILAAIASGTVFGMAGNIKKPKGVAITVSKTTCGLSEWNNQLIPSGNPLIDPFHPTAEILLVATVQGGGGDYNQIKALDWSINSVESVKMHNDPHSMENSPCPDPSSWCEGCGWGGKTFTLFTWDYKSGTVGAKDHVIITGWFCDGTPQVLLDTYV